MKADNNYKFTRNLLIYSFQKISMTEFRTLV